MAKRTICICFTLLAALPFELISQELFPHNDAASNVGKNVLSVRASSEFFNEAGQFRSWQGYRFMFGLSPKWMLTETFSFSNHHGTRLPASFISHDGTLGPHTHGGKKGIYYPYLFETLTVNIKYRFLSHDDDHRHFRMAAYLDLAGGNEAHDEAEPNLYGDNAGLGGGLITTVLLNKFAASINAGGILPVDYKETLSHIDISYGKAIFANISFGYLLLPRTYRNYRQTNVNLYAEFQCKYFGPAKVYQDGNVIPLSGATTLESGAYIEFRPSIQFIICSNTRIDLSIARPLVNRSWTHFYPVYFFTLQQNIYFNEK